MFGGKSPQEEGTVNSKTSGRELAWSSLAIAKRLGGL